MNRLLWNQAEKLIAVVAAWAIVLAPLAAVANCCCVARAATAQAAAPDQATAGRLDPVSCCATGSTDVGVSEPTPACCTPAATSKSLANSAAQSCSCQTTCCDTNVSQAVAVVGAPSPHHPLDWDALPVALLDKQPGVTRSTWSEAVRQPVFLSAHARCARLCRWLN